MDPVRSIATRRFIGEKIAMTAPVLQDQAGEQDDWRTRFVMPARYTRETLPPPPKGLSISETSARRVATIRFNGRADDEAIAHHESELKQWISGHDLQTAGPAEYAFYNSPFIPPLLRRNEILIPLGQPSRSTF